MTIQQACKILRVTKEDDEKTIKMQFRKLIAKHHPDAVGSDSPEHVEMAQLLNEAYALLRKKILNNPNRVVKKPVWKGKEKVEAFTERTIYMAGVSWEGEVPGFYEVAKGRYEWDPDLEEFECLLKSLNEVVIELLEKIEYQNEIYNYEAYNIQAQRFDYQIQLFHLLAGQFIAPVSCLQKIAIPEETDAKGRKIYKFQAFLGTKGMSSTFTAMSKLQDGELIYATSLKHNRIMVSNREGEQLGHLSLADDHLYYVVIPILQNHMAQVKFVVKECDILRRVRPYQIKVNIDLYLRMSETPKEVASNNQNNKIQALLNSYDSYLKRV